MSKKSKFSKDFPAFDDLPTERNEDEDRPLLEHDDIGLDFPIKPPVQEKAKSKSSKDQKRSSKSKEKSRKSKSKKKSKEVVTPEKERKQSTPKKKSKEEKKAS